MRVFIGFCAAAVAMSAAEMAGYDSRGHLIALLSSNGEVEVRSDYVAVLPNGRRISLKDRRVGSPPRNQGQLRAWSGPYALPDGSRLLLDWRTEDQGGGLLYTAKVLKEGAAIDRLEWVLDIARQPFVGGRLEIDGKRTVLLAAERQSLYAGPATNLSFEGSGTRLSVVLPSARELSVLDRWDVQGDVIRTRMPLPEGGQTGTMYLAHTERSWQIRIPLLMGEQPSGELSARLAVSHTGSTPPVSLSVSPERARYAFHGFGGNFCWDNGKGNRAIQSYLLDNLKLAWARAEMKIALWDANGRKPDETIRFDFENMRRFHRMGVPWVISIWRLPERFYIDAFEKPRGERFRVIDPNRWDELNDLIGSFLLFGKKEYGVEPDLFSFNEPNIGVQVGQTPEAHTEQIKRMGAAFRKLGLKTKMLLADAVPARDSHVFALHAANDAEALQYIGAAGFHSWGGATSRQYAAWGDLAEWLKVPLLVTELGVDSQAFATNSWDSYHYGIREAQMTQEILLHARPQGTQFWQYTDDFALARLRPDGSVEPTPRFWMMKHFSDLTPMPSQALETTSDAPDVLVTAFRKDSAIAVHIVNRAGAREALLGGLPSGSWRLVETTESTQFAERALASDGSPVRLTLPARSLITVTTR